MQNENNELLIDKYQPKRLSDFILDQETIQLIHILIKMNKFNLLLIGENSCGKTSMLNVILKEYYLDVSEKNKENNTLIISILKEQ